MRKGVNFAQVARGQQLQHHDVHNSKTVPNEELVTLSQFLSKFENVFTLLINQNNMILNLLTTVINNNSKNGQHIENRHLECQRLATAKTRTVFCCYVNVNKKFIPYASFYLLKTKTSQNRHPFHSNLT